MRSTDSTWSVGLLGWLGCDSRPTVLVDKAVAAIALIFLAPLFGLIGILIKLESPGPVFYRQARVGKDGRPFLLYKFRKMPHGLDRGPKISPPNDLRLTRVGRLLERLKLDELPQLLNVLRGEMRIIGPRPEVPEIVKLYTERQREVLRAWPGITGPNQIVWRNEKDLIPPHVDDVESYYVQRILPQKIETDLRYLANRSWRSDLVLLAQTVWVTLFEPFKPKHFQSKLSLLAHIGADATLLLGAALLVPIFSTGVQTGAAAMTLAKLALALAGLHFLGFLVFGVCWQSWKLASKADLWTLSKSLGITTALSILPVVFWFPVGPALRVLFLSFVFSLVMVGGGRFVVSTHIQRKNAMARTRAAVRNVVLYGVNEESELFLRRIEKGLVPGYRVLAFLDNDPRNRGLRIHNVRVVGNAADLRLLHELKGVHAVYVFAGDDDGGIKLLRKLCSELGIAFHRGPVPITVEGRRASEQKLRRSDSRADQFEEVQKPEIVG